MKRIAMWYSTVFLAIFCGAVILTSPHLALAQDTTPSPSPSPAESEELKKLKDEVEVLTEKQKKAEAEQKIAEAKKAKFEAEFPKPSTTPLAGTTTVDAGVKIESEMLAYRAIETNADKVASEISDSSIKSLAILDQKQIKLLQDYTATRVQLGLMIKGYEGQIKTDQAQQNPNFRMAVAGIGPALAAGSSMVGAFTDLLSMFRTNTTVNGMSFTVGESAFASEIFRAVRKPSSGFASDIKLYYPLEYSPKPNGLEEYPIIEKIEKLNDLRLLAGALTGQIDDAQAKKQKAEDKINELKEREKKIPEELTAALDRLDTYEKINKKYPSAEALEKVIDANKEIGHLKIEQKEIATKIQEETGKVQGAENTLKKLYGYLDCDPASDDFINCGEQIAAYLKALNAQVDKFYTAITTVSGEGVNPIGSFLQAEELKSALGCDDKSPLCGGSYILAIHVIDAGGNNRTMTNLIKDVFWGPNITHSGGAIVEYRLYDTDGVIQKSNTFAAYEPYRKAKTIGKMSDEDFKSEAQQRLDEIQKQIDAKKKELNDLQKQKQAQNGNN
jgi:hypothetical protein